MLVLVNVWGVSACRFYKVLMMTSSNHCTRWGLTTLLQEQFPTIFSQRRDVMAQPIYKPELTPFQSLKASKLEFGAS